MLTQLVSAVCFLEEVDASVLTIAHGDFERGLKGFQETARVGLKAHQLQVNIGQLDGWMGWMVCLINWFNWPAYMILVD